MNVLRVDYSQDDASQHFTRSLKNTGFAVLYNHPIDKLLIKEVYKEWVVFFASDTKENYLFNRATQDGFFPLSISEKAKGYDVKDIKEYYHFYEWGQYPEFMSDNTRKLYQQLFNFSKELLNWVEQFLPEEIAKSLSMPLSKMIENTPQSLLRILHYPPLTGDEPDNAVRAAEHGDINLITLLVGATDKGLEVRNSEGQWVAVPSDMESIVVNIGDMLETCTNGFYRSTLHRVVNPIGCNQSRLSMPLFLHPRKEVKLTQNKSAGEFLQERLKELGVV